MISGFATHRLTEVEVLVQNSRTGNTGLSVLGGCRPAAARRRLGAARSMLQKCAAHFVTPCPQKCCSCAYISYIYPGRGLLNNPAVLQYITLPLFAKGVTWSKGVTPKYTCGIYTSPFFKGGYVPTIKLDN